VREKRKRGGMLEGERGEVEGVKCGERQEKEGGRGEGERREERKWGREAFATYLSNKSLK